MTQCQSSGGNLCRPWGLGLVVPIPTTKKTKDTGCVRLTFEKLDVECLVNCDNCPIKPSWQVEWNCIFSRIFFVCACIDLHLPGRRWMLPGRKCTWRLMKAYGVLAMCTTCITPWHGRDTSRSHSYGCIQLALLCLHMPPPSKRRPALVDAGWFANQASWNVPFGWRSSWEAAGGTVARALARFHCLHSCIFGASSVCAHGLLSSDSKSNPRCGQHHPTPFQKVLHENIPSPFLHLNLRRS